MNAHGVSPALGLRMLLALAAVLVALTLVGCSSMSPRATVRGVLATTAVVAGALVGLPSRPPAPPTPPVQLTVMCGYPPPQPTPRETRRNP